MNTEFAKLHGLGNDFVFIDDLDGGIELTPSQVACLCDRHMGIGGDGVILVRPSENPECAAYMHYINSDGSLAQMCGNGVRCFAKYLVDRGIVDPAAGSFVADTLAGPKPIDFTLDAEGKLATATVDMGTPELDPKLVPTSLPANAKTDDGQTFVKEAPVDSPWGVFLFTCVSMGNPHAVCFIDDIETIDDALFPDPQAKSLETLDLGKVGAYFERHEVFPEKANIEFVYPEEAGLRMRVFERGCGETLACGTGACAVNCAAALTGRTGRENDVMLLGGTLHIQWREDGHVMMTGPAEQSFTGTVDIK